MNRSLFKISLGLLFMSGFAQTAFALEEEVSVTEAPVPERALSLGISESVRATQGNFDPYGTYNPYPAGSSAWSTSTTIAAAYRFTHLLEANVSVPIRDTEMTLPTGSRTSASLGGVSIAGRYHLGTPAHIIVHMGMGLPWKWSSSQTVGTPAASMTADASDGAPNGTSFHVGVGTIHTFGKIRLAFDGTTTYGFASDQDVNDGSTTSGTTVHLQSGMRYALREGIAYIIGSHFSVNGGLNQIWIMDSHVNGQEMAGTAGRSFSTTLGLSYFPDKTWRFSAGYDTQFPFYGYIVNQPYAPAISLSMTYAGL